MSEAPERIWAQKEAFSDDWDAGTFCTVCDGGAEYIRADHVDDLLKAEREKALREAASLSWLCFHKCDVEIDVVTVDDILALISEDATKEPSSNP